MRLSKLQWRDLTLMLGSYRADLIALHGSDADEHIAFLDAWIVEVEDDQEFDEYGVEFEFLPEDEDE